MASFGGVSSLGIGVFFLQFLASPADTPKTFVSSPRRLLTAPELLDAPDEWLSRSLRWVTYVLENYAPAVEEHPVRRAALIRLDDVLHIRSAPRKPIVQQFYRERLETAIGQIERTKVTEGMHIWKLYNHGFLVRTPTASFAIDIVPGAPQTEFAVSAELVRRLVAQSDVLFITHLHADHANPELARMFMAEGKPVAAVPGLWSEVPDLASRVTYLERSKDRVHSIQIRNGAQVLKVVAYPGHQGEEVANNVYLVTSPEGFTIVHTGDQSWTDGPGGDFEWLAEIGRHHRVDVLLPNCWAEGLDRIIRGVAPELIITGHENEMGHSVDHREDYTQTYNRLVGSPRPAVVMAWGEGYHYRRDLPRKD